MRRRIRCRLGLIMTIPATLLLWACSQPPPRALYLDPAAWPGDLAQIALVEISYDQRYRPPPGLDLTMELRRALKQELTHKGYRLLLADRGEEIYHGQTNAAELAGRAPQEADAALALHIDFLFLSTTLSERNPPPEAEIAGEARLIAKQNGKELWRDRANGLGGGAAAMPVVSFMGLRQEALANFAEQLFATLPVRSVGQ